MLRPFLLLKLQRTTRKIRLSPFFSRYHFSLTWVKNLKQDSRRPPRSFSLSLSPPASLSVVCLCICISVCVSVCAMNPVPGHPTLWRQGRVYILKGTVSFYEGQGCPHMTLPGKSGQARRRWHCSGDLYTIEGSLLSWGAVSLDRSLDQTLIREADTV